MLASGTDIKETILRQYDEVISIVNNCGKLPASLLETVAKHHERLLEKRKEFSEELCQVVVSGKKEKNLRKSKHTRCITDIVQKIVLPWSKMRLCHWIKRVM